MRGHYLGIPKTSKSRRTITIAPSVVTILRRAMKGKSPDDFVFTTAARSTSSASLRRTGGRPIHAGDFSDQRWLPALKAAKTGGREATSRHRKWDPDWLRPSAVLAQDGQLSTFRFLDSQGLVNTNLTWRSKPDASAAATMARNLVILESASAGIRLPLAGPGSCRRVWTRTGSVRVTV